MCDNVNCTNKMFKPLTYITVLIAEFDFDVCWWCTECIKRDKSMIYMSYLEIINLNKRLNK
ncbi:hypothetical protein LCGC14_2577380 [marine sediment metagenome]|uniref:Uncharacterized protein n=1 Tax=marine sediment metagenome TaxID=412755 RepID=A0A0F9AFI3_9ZZZZ